MNTKSSIYIDVHAYRTRVAVTCEGELSEFYLEKNSKLKTVGSIYRGKVVNVLSGMNAAFVNIGLEKNAYLYVGGGLVDSNELENLPKADEEKLKVSVGDEIMVQVVKDQSGTKGARVTQEVSIAGRFLVYMPYVNYIGISCKIEDEHKRMQLQGAVSALTVGGGFVVRTAAAAATIKEIQQEAKFLAETFKGVQAAFEKGKALKCVYTDGDIVFRTIRDLYSRNVENIITNNKECYSYLTQILDKMCPGHKTKISLFEGVGDMFHEHRLSAKVEGLLKKKVVLKNGAYLVIDKTEALTAIDVNTGKYVGNTENLEETVFTTNMLAAREIARQIRLRNLGGIIIADFIDMVEEPHRKQVLQELEIEFKKDRIKSTVVGMTNLGLVEITRKKVRNSISSTLMRECPYCNGNGEVYSYEYMCMRVRVALLELFRHEAAGCLISVNPDVFHQLFTIDILRGDAQSIWRDKRIYIVANAAISVTDFNLERLEGSVLQVPDNAKLMC